VVVMGFVDDRWGMGAISKLAGQVAAGVILVWSGAEVTWLPAPNRGTLSLTSDQQIAVTILVVVITINAVNFMDGLDGLAAGIVGIGAAAFFIYYFTLTQRLGLPDQTSPALGSAVLAGVCLGFLPHNFHPARIFMGDTGAMLIGLLLAYVPISSLASLDPVSLTNHRANAVGTVNRFGAILPLLLPAAILLIPYTDLLLAVVRRARAGLSPFAPDRKHLHHRMLEIGHSHRTSVLIMYLWAALFAGSVVWLSLIRTRLFVLVIVTVGAMLALLFVSMPRLRPWARHAVGGAAAGPPRGRGAVARVPAGRAAGAAGAAGGAAAVPAATGAHARPSAPPSMVHASARSDPGPAPPAAPARPARRGRPARSAPAQPPARPPVPVAASRAGSSSGQPVPPGLSGPAGPPARRAPQASFHPAPLPDAVPGSTGADLPWGGAEGAQARPRTASPRSPSPAWPEEPPEPPPAWPDVGQEPPPAWPDVAQDSSLLPWPEEPPESSPPWPPAPAPPSRWPLAPPAP
jgi:UDP-GlcNAc:undecaprenyl-phosphate/decaprenyl-phosphate GlcNAc-1-phosphate transferase